jgi:hypothetical protein
MLVCANFKVVLISGGGISCPADWLCKVLGTRALGACVLLAYVCIVLLIPHKGVCAFSEQEPLFATLITYS